MVLGSPRFSNSAGRSSSSTPREEIVSITRDRTVAMCIAITLLKSVSREHKVFGTDTGGRLQIEFGEKTGWHCGEATRVPEMNGADTSVSWPKLGLAEVLF